MRTLLVALTSALLLACGGSDTPGQDGSSGGDAAPSVSGGDCDAYDANDACITEQNLAQCREMAERCPGRVLVRESCPLQFACP